MIFILFLIFILLGTEVGLYAFLSVCCSRGYHVFNDFWIAIVFIPFLMQLVFSRVLLFLVIFRRKLTHTVWKSLVTQVSPWSRCFSSSALYTGQGLSSSLGLGALKLGLESAAVLTYIELFWWCQVWVIVSFPLLERTTVSSLYLPVRA